MLTSAHASKLIVFGSILAGAIWTATLVLRHAVEFPFMDSWVVAQYYVAFKRGSLRLVDLFSQYNLHRPFAPLLVFLLNFSIFGWSTIATLLLNVILASATAVVLVRLVGQTVEGAGWLFSTVGLVVAIQVFNLSQFVNWLMEFDLCWYIFNLGAVTFFYFLNPSGCASNPNLCAAVAALGALAATYSLAGGLLLWPIGAAFLIFNRASRVRLLAWLAVSAIVFAAYLWNLRPEPLAPKSMGNAEKILAIGEFLARFLGMTVGEGYLAGLLLTIFGGVAGVLCLKQELRSRAAPWLGLATFVALCGLSAGVTRAPVFGPTEGASTRYGTVAGLFVIAVVTLIAIAGSHWRQLRLVSVGLIGAVAIASALHYPSGYAQFLWLADRLNTARECVRRQGPADECLSLVFVADQTHVARQIWNDVRKVGWRGAQ